jgi:peptide-methionine (S)-S-oxide reductase
MVFGQSKNAMIAPGRALKGHPDYTYAVPDTHDVNGHRITAPFPDGLQTAVFGLGCFWGAERLFWETPGVYSSAVGYAGGYTTFPTYDEVCSGRTGHTEVVLVVFDPATISYGDLVRTFFEGHNPTQGYRQSNDAGTQYRSAIYTTADQDEIARSIAEAYSAELTARKMGRVTTEIAPLREFYYAERYHQQYLSKNPFGYCGLGGTGVSCPSTVAPAPLAH